MATTIKLKNGSGAPLASDLVQGEPAFDLTNKRLYTEDSGGNVLEIGTKPSTIDIDAGTIDGATIGGTTAAEGTFTTANATTVDTTNIEVTNIKAKDGTSAGSIADSTGVVTLASSVLTTADINGGTVDGVTIGGTTAAAGTFTTATASTETDTSNTGSVTLDFSADQNFVLTLTGNVTLANPSTEIVGQSGFIVFIQDGTGGRTVSLGTDYETAGGAGLTLSSAASTTDIVPYVVAASGRILLGAPQLAFS